MFSWYNQLFKIEGKGLVFFRTTVSYLTNRTHSSWDILSP